ncbi:hypothetical protein NONO_c42260 [Nocardia nova SH22a]|uniref:DUF695 domain-containing protein n=1 Tax=Nocardia nova SH22a TaxID=1415166 RepID=W5TI32_9NOCA|nr:hypothetical protein [Nocardia nova]AHH19010.1 hypothetical protein NONO_c42260 [Nocardia nova SH22a]
MTELPNKSVLVRTWFGDDRAWGSLVREVLTPSKEGFLAYTTVVSDPEFEGLSPEALKAKHPGGAIASFLADEITLTDPEHPLLAVWILPPQEYDRGDHQPFRVVPDQLASVDVNINDANLDWRDFADRVDADGIYRGQADVKESDFEFSVRCIMADRLAHLTPGLTESIRIAESPDEGAGMAVISSEDDPQTVREQLASLRSYPAALSWDWVAAFDAEHADNVRADYTTAFLEEIGEHAFAVGAVLASLSSGEDYYLVFVTPIQFDELSRLFTAHAMRAEKMRRGHLQLDPEQSAVIRDWARGHGRKVTARGMITATLESPGTPEATEPDRLA